LPRCEWLIDVQLRHPVGKGAGGLLDQHELKCEPPRHRHAAFAVDALGDEAMLTQDHPAGPRVVPKEKAEACAGHPAGANLHSRLALRRVSIELEPASPHGLLERVKNKSACAQREGGRVGIAIAVGRLPGRSGGAATAPWAAALAAAARSDRYP